MGLRWRLAGWVTLVVIACSAITFISVYGGTGSQLRHQIDGEISGDAEELDHAMTSAGTRSPVALRRAADNYIRAQPFSATSTLLYVVIPGAGTSTNRPELFSLRAPDDGESAAAQASENRLAARLLRTPATFSTLSCPDVGQLRLLRRTVKLRRGSGQVAQVVVGVGEPLASVARAQDGVARAFILAGLLALVGAVLAALLIGTRLSNPLRRMAAVAAQVDGGDLHPRIHDTDRAAGEVRMLAESFNHMLDRLTDAFAGQRAFVADASHELRTPLTVIQGQLEVLAAQEEPAIEEIRRVEALVQAEVARITRLVDDLLLLARSEQTEFLRPEEIELEPFVVELWDGATLLEGGRHFELGPVVRGVLRADPDRLAQALRNLLRNAVAHTRAPDGLVRLSVVQPRPGRILFAVEDDGPGIAPEARELVFERFHRTDAARDRASGGTGLGLAIVRAIADAHDGAARADVAAAGGARLELELPGFRLVSSPDADGAQPPAGVTQTG